RSGHFPRLGVARANPELLLKLQVREAPHRLRSHRGLRCLLKEAPVLLHGLIEALFDFHFLQVRTHVPQLRQRPRGPHWLDGTRGATDHENRRDHYRNGEVTHQCPPASDCARAARSKLSATPRSEEHTSELQSRGHLVCRLLLEKKKN